MFLRAVLRNLQAKRKVIVGGFYVSEKGFSRSFSNHVMGKNGSMDNTTQLKVFCFFYFTISNFLQVLGVDFFFINLVWASF